MSFQIYRNTTIGICLQEALYEIKHNYQLPDDLFSATLEEFDRVIENRIKEVKTNVTLTGKLLSYRFCDSVWTLIMTKAEFTNNFPQETKRIEKVKIVAIAAKPSSVLSNGRSISSKSSSKRSRNNEDDDIDESDVIYEEQSIKRSKNRND